MDGRDCGVVSGVRKGAFLKLPFQVMLMFEIVGHVETSAASGSVTGSLSSSCSRHDR
jgi:hypothetical protein